MDYASVELSDGETHTRLQPVYGTEMGMAAGR